MGILFGTDGIRGVANETLDCRLAYRVGQSTAIQLAKRKGGRPLVILGKDTRLSSDMLEAALSAGLCAGGCNVVQLGVVPTPAVAYLTVCCHADAGGMISASHNPYSDNGIKMFSAEGFKLSDDLEHDIEQQILVKGAIPVKAGSELGRIYNGDYVVEEYIKHLQNTVAEDLTDLRVVVDCANGSASKTARRLLSRFNLEVTYMNDQPNGVNINDRCGSTHLEALQERVLAGCYDLGIAFDGDADRCLIVDEKGRCVDGDRMMALFASERKEAGRLPGDGFVATVMSNLGLHKYAETHGLRLLCSAVGDRNVLELMQEKGMVLGGEQSGHIIFLEHMTTGDGQLAALQFLQIVCRALMPVSQLSDAVPQYPQVLLGIRVPEEKKAAILASPAVREAVSQAEAQLGGDGRVLVRASGTEPLIRVMVEAGTQELAKNAAELVAASVENTQK